MLDIVISTYLSVMFNLLIKLLHNAVLPHPLCEWCRSFTLLKMTNVLPSGIIYGLKVDQPYQTLL